ncbi:FHA domain protein [compost metagenome]|uniref:FHA domain protein n=1 Tax=Pseudomonas jinjuensis TaxID=198616 RepID=A0A1H0BVD5_9PSED|nr:type VI secretion system-associated FHA domain protein TagH [Pseudomonas jinjuensis]SDN49578.1 FHA domain protein [Pseudomonas jinjuensis]
MELVFEMVSAQQFVPGLLTSKTFKEAGGIIGRSADCDWVIPDRNRHLSNHHAQVSYRDGAFYLTDTSSNGTLLKDSGARLPPGHALRIEHGTVYCMGDFEIRARLVQDPALFDEEIGRPRAAGSIIPDDAFLDLDPLTAIEQQERIYVASDDYGMLDANQAHTRHQADYAPIDIESLPLPQLVAPPPEAPVAHADEIERQPDGFWQRFGDELGISLDGFDQDAREALATQAARLLRQCVGGLQQSLRTRTELKNELRLALTTAQGHSGNPLKSSADSREALSALLLAAKPGQASPEQSVGHVFRDLQAHQVALLSASRAALRSTLEHFAPERLALRFERDGQVSRLTGASGRWRAYGRYHQSLRQDDEWSERLLSRDFAQAYEEQVRLIATLNSESQG